MKNILNWLQQRRPRRHPRRPYQTQLQVETLETRLVPATIGANKFAVLDFDGDFVSSTQLAQGGWYSMPDKNLGSFHDLFNNSRPWLDMDGDGLVNNVDANLAIDHIMAKVQQDFMPYKLDAFQGDQDTYQRIFNDSIVGDTMVMITSTSDTAFQPGLDAFGVAPKLDTGNVDEDMVLVFAGEIANGFAGNRDKFLNEVAHTITHEIGHAVGLDHEISEFGNITDAFSHSVMAVPTGNTEVRDFSKDFTFQDRSFITESGTFQNAHRHLLNESILGRSDNAGVAVHQQGILTIYGNDFANSISVDQGVNDTWNVTIDGRTYSVGRNAEDANSLNPFDQPLTSVLVHAEGGADFVVVRPEFDFRTSIHAGAANDTVFGGPNTDYIFGGDGNDTILGGAGNDSLHGGNGNDFILGGQGNDYITGGEGRDQLFGEAGNDYIFGNGGYDVLNGGSGDDYLDGGADGIADSLTGGSGNDRFKAEYYWAWDWVNGLSRRNRDVPLDFFVGDRLV